MDNQGEGDILEQHIGDPSHKQRAFERKDRDQTKLCHATDEWLNEKEKTCYDTLHDAAMVTGQR